MFKGVLLGFMAFAAYAISDAFVKSLRGSLPAYEAVFFGAALGLTALPFIKGADDRWHGKPLHEAIVESLRANDIAGVTVYRGIAGYGAHGRFRKERRLSLSTDAPIMLSVVDEDARIRAYLPTLEQMVQEGLVALSDVDVIKYTHRVTPADDAKKDTP